MASLPVNLFDAAVYICLAVAIIAGFRSGLLRSMATILGYVAAMPIAVAAAPRLSQILIEQFKLPQAQTWLVLSVIFLVIGIVLGALLRMAVSEMAGPNVSVPDRAAGAALGAVRVALLAVVLVLIFDRIIPAGREGLKSLPPEVVDTIDRLKKERGL